MDKFKIVKNISQPVAFRPIQIRVTTYDTLKMVQNETGVNLAELVDNMVRFCAERLEVIEPEE